MHPVPGRYQRLLDVRRAVGEEAPAYVPSRLVLPALLSGLRAQASCGAVAGVVDARHTADPIGRARRDAMNGATASPQKHEF